MANNGAQRIVEAVAQNNNASQAERNKMYENANEVAVKNSGWKGKKMPSKNVK